VWWMTSKLPPSDGYSLESELKQCGHEATTLRHAGGRQRLDVPAGLCLEQVFVAEPADRVACARLGGPSTAKLTPARCIRRASACVVRRARSSSAPAQPTQKRYSILSGIERVTIGTSKSSPAGPLESPRGPRPHGSPRFSTLRSIEAASGGKRASFMTA